MSEIIKHDAGEKWDESDVHALMHYLADHNTHQQIADKMGRTASAVRTKIYRLRRQHRFL